LLSSKKKTVAGQGGGKEDRIRSPKGGRKARVEGNGFTGGKFKEGITKNEGIDRVGKRSVCYAKQDRSPLSQPARKERSFRGCKS